MSCIVTREGILHFESVGRGQPLVLLHGWINSWDVWRESMLALAANGQNNGRIPYRVFALDFWGFGNSTTPPQAHDNPYQLASYVEMVREFMDNLGIAKAPIAGHSMGGTVALQLALHYPERFDKVVIVGAPIVGTSLNPFLKLAGYGWIAKLVWRVPAIRSLIMHLILAGDSNRVRNMIFRDVTRTNLDSFFRSIGDLRATDLRPDLSRLSVPTLGIYGRHDNIVSPGNAAILDEGSSQASISLFDNSRHFPMADEPAAFVDALNGFLQPHYSGHP